MRSVVCIAPKYAGNRILENAAYMSSPSIPQARSIGALKRANIRILPVKEELRNNCIAKLRAREKLFDGIIGYDDTVVPAVINAILSRHDIILLGLRGQAKTRLVRMLPSLLDEWTPIVKGSELNDNPFHPISKYATDLIAEYGDDTEIEWIPREQRYGEKLATPDVTIADLIGDIDPIKAAAQRLHYSHEGAIHFGLIPRTNRGIFAINELPDLQPRIQVGLFNIMQEKDIQIRGFNVRIPLDVLIVFTANPEDYTNRGRIITPLKDRFGAEIRTHYPVSLEAETELILQEASIEAVVPRHLLDAVARFTRLVRDSPAVDQRSGVSARFAIACVEALSGAAVRRAALSGETEPVARIGDLAGIVPTLRGKVEFDVSEEGREEETLQLLARRASADGWRAALGGGDVRPLLTSLVAWFDEGGSLDTGDAVPAATVLAELGPTEGLGRLVRSLEGDMAESPGLVAACVEFAVEGLWLTRRIDKDTVDGINRYGAS